MHNVFLILGLALMTPSDSDLTTDLLTLAAAPWVVIDDGVMGGRSAGQVSVEDGVSTFSGTLSLENHGGFSSIRLPLRQSLAGFSGIRLNVRGDGRVYQLRLRHGNRFDGVAWRTDFSTQSEWTSIDFSFDQFTPGFRGRSVPQAGPVVAGDVRQIGILLGDKNPGPFELEIRSIEGIPD